jgi:hypothetical protein
LLLITTAFKPGFQSPSSILYPTIICMSSAKDSLPKNHCVQKT